MTLPPSIPGARHSATGRWWMACILTLGSASSACAAQTQPPPSQNATVRVQSAAADPAQKSKPSAAQSAAAGGETHVAALPGPSNATAVAPQVSLHDGTLTVVANNADLSTILKDVAGTSGMTIDGLNKSTRVFGVYGPGNPREVLTDLLSGTGYNFLMMGGANGSVPRELVLTAQSNAPSPRSAGASQAASSADDADSDADDQEPLGPGAIPHPPPEPTDDPQARAQQRLRNLQMMRDQLQQQQQEQNNNPQ